MQGFFIRLSQTHPAGKKAIRIGPPKGFFFELLLHE